MDSGGANFQNLFGVGPDGIGGTAHDPNVKFGEDDYTPVEGFTGIEDTLNVTAWAYPDARRAGADSPRPYRHGWRLGSSKRSGTIPTQWPR